MKTQNQKLPPARGQGKRDRMCVRDVMTTDVESVLPTESVRDVARKLGQLDIGSLPVCEEGQLLGIVTDRDIALRVVADGRSPSVCVADVMTETLVWAYDDDEIQALAKKMRDKAIRRVPVIDRKKNLVGIVSLADLALSDASNQVKAATLQGVSS